MISVLGGKFFAETVSQPTAESEVLSYTEDLLKLMKLVMVVSESGSQKANMSSDKTEMPMRVDIGLEEGKILDSSLVVSSTPITHQ